MQLKYLSLSESFFLVSDFAKLPFLWFWISTINHGQFAMLVGYLCSWNFGSGLHWKVPVLLCESHMFNSIFCLQKMTAIVITDSIVWSCHHFETKKTTSTFLFLRTKHFKSAGECKKEAWKFLKIQQYWHWCLCGYFSQRRGSNKSSGTLARHSSVLTLVCVALQSTAEGAVIWWRKKFVLLLPFCVSLTTRLWTNKRRCNSCKTWAATTRFSVGDVFSLKSHHQMKKRAWHLKYQLPGNQKV